MPTLDLVMMTMPEPWGLDALIISGGGGDATKMVLGSYTFYRNPKVFHRVYLGNKDVGTIKTMESEGSFDFGIRPNAEGLIGSRWSMSWPQMLRTQYDLLRAQYESVGTKLWNPQAYRAHEPGKTYQVLVVDLQADDYSQFTVHVKDVEMTLEITAVN